MLASFDLTSNPFVNTPAYKALAHLPLAERIVELRKPEVRARILGEDPDEALLPLTAMTRQYDVMFELSEPPCYEPEPGSSIADKAAREGRPAQEVAYDLLLEDGGKGMLLVAFGNWPGDSLDHMFEFFDDPYAVMGLGDGGAHYGLICDSSYPSFVLTHWARDRQGRKLSIAQAVRAMTAHPASIIGLNDRGIIARGYKADINIIDHARLTLHAPEIVDDLPEGMPMDVASVLGCAVLTGIGSVTGGAQVTPGSKVVVLGCGGVGLNVVQGARLAGAAQIIAVDLNPAKLELARQFGATHTVLGGVDAVAQVVDLTNGGADYAFEVVGVPALARQGLMMLRKRGTLTLVGLPKMGSDLLVPIMTMIGRETRVIGSNMGSVSFQRVIPTYAQLYLEGRLLLDPLISQRIALEDINRGYEQLIAGETARSVIVFDH